MTEKKQTEITTLVLNRYNEMAKSSEINVPKNYSAANALKAAYFEIENAKDNNKKPVLESCSRSSILKSLMYMVTRGLNPAKNQCYFIPYNGELTCSESYFASEMLAKRYSGVQSIRANIIRKDDIYKTATESDGRKVLVEHVQPFENLDKDILGAYCVVIEADGKEVLTEMTITQIKKAWAMGYGYGKSKVHQDFNDEMCKKTVIKRACKHYINASDDEALLDGETPVIDEAIETDYEEIKEEPQQIPEEITAQKPTKKADPKKEPESKKEAKQPESKQTEMNLNEEDVPY